MGFFSLFFPRPSSVTHMQGHSPRKRTWENVSRALEVESECVCVCVQECVYLQMDSNHRCRLFCLSLVCFCVLPPVVMSVHNCLSMLNIQDIRGNAAYEDICGGLLIFSKRQKSLIFFFPQKPPIPFTVLIHVPGDLTVSYPPSCLPPKNSPTTL